MAEVIDDLRRRLQEPIFCKDLFYKRLKALLPTLLEVELQAIAKLMTEQVYKNTMREKEAFEDEILQHSYPETSLNEAHVMVRSVIVAMSGIAIDILDYETASNFEIEWG